jgi:hypothetical protein
MTSLVIIDICEVSFRIRPLYSWYNWFVLFSKHLQIPTHKITISLTVLDYVGVE